MISTFLAVSSFFLLAVSQSPSPAPRNLCMPAWQCQFQYTTLGQTYYWDLSSLCQPNGEYFYEGPMSTYQRFSFNVCGNTSSICSDYVNTLPMYESHGVATQLVSISQESVSFTHLSIEVI